MSRTSLSFNEYISNNLNKSQNIKTFIELFESDMHNLPDKVVSSKRLMSILNVDTPSKFAIFQNAFMEYFAEKIRLSL
jgi:hypothetical protein